MVCVRACVHVCMRVKSLGQCMLFPVKEICDLCDLCA